MHSLLKLIFALKGNLARGLSPERKCIDGVEVAPFLDNSAGAASISADFELNWAWRELPAYERDRLGLKERQNVPYLISLLNDVRVPVTWATVGHLFIERCRRAANGHAHADMPRPPANDRWAGDWYRDDPCSNLQESPLWYAPDLIRHILASPVRHEIGSHSFSHIDFSEPYSNPGLVERELQQCVSAMAPFGTSPRTLVYPFNRKGASSGT